MSVPSYAPLGARAQWAVGLLVATTAVHVIAIISNVWEIVLIGRFLGGDLDPAPLGSSDDRQAFVALLEFAVLVVCGITFIRWFSRAYRNSAALKPSPLHFKPGWAIGSWFVPILNLWRPKQMANEIWAATAAETSLAEGPPAQPYQGTRLLTLWWIFWLVSGVFGNIVARRVFGGDTLEDIRDTDRLDIVALALEIVAAVLAILVVQRITDRQIARAEELSLH